VKGYLIFNPYYTDDGQEHVKRRLTDCFLKRGVNLIPACPYAMSSGRVQEGGGGKPPACASVESKMNEDAVGRGLAPAEMTSRIPDAEFAVFWDKDAGLAKFLEKCGIRVFNNPFAIEACDDKRKTYETIAASKTPVTLIPTFFSRLAYAPLVSGDMRLLDLVESTLPYPIVVKENVGSLGRQVYLAKSRAELETLHKRLFSRAHQYQRFVGAPGTDTRVYTVGGKAVAAYRRKNPSSFISNAARGGITERIELPESLKTDAEAVARALRLDFGAVDFLEEDGRYYFLEANSNAYFKAAELTGIDIAGRIADFVLTHNAQLQPHND